MSDTCRHAWESLIVAADCGTWRPAGPEIRMDFGHSWFSTSSTSSTWFQVATPVEEASNDYATLEI